MKSLNYKPLRPTLPNLSGAECLKQHIPFKFVKKLMLFGIKLRHEYGGITFKWDYEDAIFAFEQLGINIIYPDRLHFLNSEEYYNKCNNIIEINLNNYDKEIKTTNVSNE